MPPKRKPFCFNYDDLIRATGGAKKGGALQQHKSSGYFYPEKIETMAVYLARYGSQELKTAIGIALNSGFQEAAKFKAIQARIANDQHPFVV